MENKKVTTEEITAFLNGRDPLERIVSIECSYDTDNVSVIYVDDKGTKRVKIEPFKPFVWVKRSAAVKMFDGDRRLLKRKMMSYGINVKALISNLGGPEEERLENGYKFLFYATKKMSFKKFQMFFNEAKTPIYPRAKKGEQIQSKDKEILAVSPVEQYMIYTGKRLFKGYENYDDLKRMLFDIETTGLNARVDSIDQIGVRTNKGFERIIKVEGTGRDKDESEINAIVEFCKIIGEEKPDVIAGHNSENFDWDFIITRCEMLGYDFKEISERYIKHPIYKKDKETVLKLGGEVEYYKPTILWGHNILDSLHAVRRAQAIDSSMESANLKYVTKYLNQNKSNRVYVKGNEIGKIWSEKSEVFAFNDENGDWYRVSDENPLKDGYVMKSGEYIVERYLLDDIWETDKVELTLNESNFLVCKMLPTTFSRACTMGTAGIWKLIMLTWSYENNLTIPAFGNKKRFTGGLSRLLSTGYVDRIVKLDYNSLYPSIILTWNINSKADVSKAMTEMLHYVLSQRELYKGLKADAGEKANYYKKQLKEILSDAKKRKELEELITHWKLVKSSNDKKQLPLKIFCNSAFGSFGSPYLFNWGDSDAAERTTCVGRQMLRLMISHFSNLGYKPIVGDSFTGDTPLFIKYEDSGLIDIKPIEELVENTKVDELGREYDINDKNYYVLCRSGWVKPSYIYRHKTDKAIYRVENGNVLVDVTEDHSLFDSGKNKVKPVNISERTVLEFSENIKIEGGTNVSENELNQISKLLMNGTIDRIPINILNLSDKTKINNFLKKIEQFDDKRASKTCRAGILYLKDSIDGFNF